jgi:hypothetical protein
MFSHRPHSLVTISAALGRFGCPDSPLGVTVAPVTFKGASCRVCTDGASEGSYGLACEPVKNGGMRHSELETSPGRFRGLFQMEIGEQAGLSVSEVQNSVPSRRGDLMVVAADSNGLGLVAMTKK